TWVFFFFSRRRRHTRFSRDWSSDVCSSDLAGYLPAGSTVEDWPLSYADLEPYYDHIEYEVGVSGKAGNIQGRLDPLGNVFEGPRSEERRVGNECRSVSARRDATTASGNMGG